VGWRVKWGIITEVSTTSVTQRGEAPNSQEEQVERVRLLDADPDLGAFLGAEEAAAARQLIVPVIKIGRGENAPLDARLKRVGAFGALMLEGMVLHELQVGGQVGMRLAARATSWPSARASPPS
jgi:hypothetical protein